MAGPSVQSARCCSTSINIGRVIRNKRKFVPVQGKEKRRAVLRPESAWKRLDCPEQVIIDPNLWDKRRRSSSPKGRAFAARDGPQVQDAINISSLGCSSAASAAAA